MKTDKAMDFILYWIIGLPISLSDQSKYKLIRIIGFLIFIPWCIPVLAICTPFILILLFIDLITIL
jgi:hypothetical protein